MINFGTIYHLRFYSCMYITLIVNLVKLGIICIILYVTVKLINLPQNQESCILICNFTLSCIT